LGEGGFLVARGDLASTGLPNNLTVLRRPVFEGHQFLSNVSVGFERATEGFAHRRMVPG
jgi:hypothetical protein